MNVAESSSPKVSASLRPGIPLDRMGLKRNMSILAAASLAIDVLLQSPKSLPRIAFVGPPGRRERGCKAARPPMDPR